MFGYWPWIGLISTITLLTAIMIIKWGDRICQARLTPIDHSRPPQFGAQVGGGPVVWCALEHSAHNSYAIRHTRMFQIE